MLLMIDNYDSFTYNLVQYLGELGADVHVHRNDALTLEQVEAWHPEKIVVSPGPCTPNEAGISVPLIQRFAEVQLSPALLRPVFHGVRRSSIKSSTVFGEIPGNAPRSRRRICNRARSPESVSVNADTNGSPHAAACWRAARIVKFSASVR